MLKAILSCISISENEINKGTRGEVNFDSTRLMEIFTSIEQPPYREHYTSVLGNLCQFVGKDKKKGDFLRVLITMPSVSVQKEGAKAVTKYLQTDEFSQLLSQKFENWIEFSTDLFKNELGAELEKIGDLSLPDFRNSFYGQVMHGQKQVYLPRYKDSQPNQEHQFLNFDQENLGSLSCATQKADLQ